MQQIDSRVKLLSIAALASSAVAVRTVTPLIVLLVAVLVLCVASRIPLKFFLKRTTIFIPIFAGVIALPLPFITPGAALASLEYGRIAVVVTREGLYRAVQFTLRIWVCVALSILLMLTTRFPRFIQAMESLRFPGVFVTMTSITYRFMFLFVNEAYRMVLAKESRTTKRLRWRENLKLLANMIATLLIRAYERGERVYLAMLSRGYTRRLRTLENMRCTPRDWSFAGVSLLTCLTVLLVDYFRVGGF